MALAVSAQVENQALSLKLERPVLVVLDEDYGEEYNQMMRQLIPEQWTLSNYAFVERPELADLKKDINNVFIIRAENEGVDGSVKEYPVVVRVVHFARTGRMRNNITSVPLDVSGTQTDRELSLIHALRVLQDKVYYRLAREADAEVNEYEKFVAKRIDRLSETTIYMAREDLDLEAVDLSKYWDGKIELVSTKELKTLMRESESGTAYARITTFKIGAATTSLREIVACDSGEVLYTAESSGLGASGFGKKDFKAMAH